jgi:hypothetical protein
VKAAPFKWSADFTPASSETLAHLHERLLAVDALTPQTLGYRVRDVRWESEGMTLEIEEGVLYPEPAIEGHVAGVFFTGRARISFTPRTRSARDDLRFLFNAEALRDEPIEFAYLFSLRKRSILDELGLHGTGGEPWASDPAYRDCKSALGQMGMSLTLAFLNREGAARGTVHVLFVPSWLRTATSSNAYVKYAFEPLEEWAVSLALFGHSSLGRLAPYKHHFYTVSSEPSVNPQNEARTEALKYGIRLALAGTKDVDEETALELVPGRGVRALDLELTPRLEVNSVHGPDGQPLEFLQWEFLLQKPDFDRRLVIRLGAGFDGDGPHTITVRASGPLFDPFQGAYFLAEEDAWHPRVDDPDGAVYALSIAVPKNQRAVFPGRLVSEQVANGRRLYEFRTERPHRRASLYYGDYRTVREQADDTTIEVYARRAGVEHGELDRVAKEVANMVRVYNRLYFPLDLETLRVAATPAGHGRGFEGLILLGERGFRNSSYGDVFIAHEVAHQWWGNLVDGKNWPQDRWISESFAEFSAMEFFDYRYQKPDRTRKMIRQLWVKPVLRSPMKPVVTATGEKRRQRASEISALIDGADNVYDKGPLVLRMLRYWFRVQSGSDELWWETLREFLRVYSHDRADTADFLRIAERRLGGSLSWFRDQWILGTRIPTVRWKHDVAPAEDGTWVVTVEARQENTAYLLAIPVFVRVDGRTIETPLIVKGRHGSTRITVGARPDSVTLNDGFEALVNLKH